VSWHTSLRELRLEMRPFCHKPSATTNPVRRLGEKQKRPGRATHREAGPPGHRPALLKVEQEDRVLFASLSASALLP